MWLELVGSLFRKIYCTNEYPLLWKFTFNLRSVFKKPSKKGSNIKAINQKKKHNPKK